MKRLFYIVIAALMVLAVASCKKDNDGVDKASLIIDGVEYRDFMVSMEDGLEGEAFNFIIFYGAEANNYIKICVYGDLHFGKKIDLTRGEGNVERSWDIFAYENGGYLFRTSGHPEAPYVLFKSGTLKITREQEGSDNFTFSLKGGKVTDVDNGDGKEHSVEFEYSGPVSKVIIL